MPDIGLLELVLIAIVAFLVLGPERMPEFFAQIGRFMRRARRWGEEIKRQLDQETNQLREPIEALHEVVDAEPMNKEKRTADKSEDS
ncbi:MAG: twin-arginine translocase subunit TatB [Zetaproteobacteria bacterium]|nr:MAG: twin-arginine translocase subunit TatB [Zetaproteobacteria bacterium]